MKIFTTLHIIFAVIALVNCRITNTNVKRQVDLAEQGSSLVIFNNEITFTRDAEDEYYYYCVAKDYAWSFVAL